MAVPVILGFGIKPVRKCSDAGPDYALVDRAFSILQEDAFIGAAVEGWIVLVRYCWIHHHNVMLIMTMQEVDKLADFFEWKAIRIQSEDFAAVHVINICPHCFEGDMVGTVVGNDRSDLIDILVAITALMKPYQQSAAGLDETFWEFHRGSNMAS